MWKASIIQATVRSLVICLGAVATCWPIDSLAVSLACGSEQQRRKISRIGKVQAEACLGPSGAIWLIKRIKSEQYEIYAPALQEQPIFLPKTTKNRDVELVGGEKNIRFLTTRTVEVEGRNFVPVLFAHRSSDNDGSGACGAGMEISLIPLEIDGKKLHQRHPLLIESCLKNIFLDSDGPDRWMSLSVKDNGKVVIRWQSYSGYRGPVKGEFDMRSGEVMMIGEKQ